MEITYGNYPKRLVAAMNYLDNVPFIRKTNPCRGNPKNKI